MLGLLAGWTALAVLASAVPSLVPFWTGVGLALVAALIVDGVRLARLPWPTVTRTVPQALSLSEWQDVTLTVSGSLKHPLTVEVFDHTPASFVVEGLPRTIALPARGRASTTYRVRPLQRGQLDFPKTALRLLSPLGLLLATRTLDTLETVKVYPNFRRVSQLAGLALDRRAGAFGVHLQRRRGEGLEFHQLREYREGDSMRQIDWKAASRRGRLMSREYREEKDQNVILMLDCGRRMHTRDGELTFFDRVLDSALLLSYVALRQGDAVGVMTFSGVDRWTPPRKGRAAMNTLLNTVFDLQTSTAPSDFSEAAHRLATRQRRRSLVVVLTNLREDDGEALTQALAPLRRRHVVLVASLREAALGEALCTPLKTWGDGLRYGAVQHYLERRDRAHEGLARAGLRPLDVEPAQLPTALVRSYLDIKRAGVL